MFFCYPLYCNHCYYSENTLVFESPKPNINLDIIKNPDKIICNLDSNLILKEDFINIEKIDIISDIKMSDFIKKNYNKKKFLLIQVILLVFTLKNYLQKFKIFVILNQQKKLLN